MYYSLFAVKSFNKLGRKNFRSKILFSCCKCISVFSVRKMGSADVQRNGKLISSIHSEVVTSASDLRHYRGLKLSNGMKIMLISDPNTDKSAAAMDVNIGSLCDPDDLPGLAHFCEHMLFLGTKKYPDEAEYLKFISQHAGSCNAFTSGEHTNYYFDIGHEHLREILDRFSEFFHSPLFDASCTDREVNAVHSEHEKNIMSDAWRLHQLDRSTSDPKHRYSRFSTGNKDTLDRIPKANKVCVRDELLKYHDHYYSSNVMSLAVLGKESLDQLEAMVVGLFSDIKDKNVKPLVFPTSPYRDEDLQKLIQVVPIKDVRNLILTFPIPDGKEFYKCHPEGYLAHMIGHEGPGSLLSELKNLGWVNALCAGEQGGARGYAFFMINVDLTEDGMDHINDIVMCMFQYIALLRKSGIQEWIFTEIKELNELNFRFKDKERPTSCVMKISQASHYYPLEDVLSAGVILTDFRPDLIINVLEKLIPSNVRISVIAKSFDEVATESEKWYGTKYRMEAISPQQIEEWTNAPLNPKFYLPTKNEFIPTDFTIAPLPDTPSTIPVSIKKAEFSQVWFKQDDQFKLPKACLMFELFSPSAYCSPNNANMIYMFAELFKDALNEYAYDADLAGLRYYLKNSLYGIQVDIKGYHSKQIVLLEKIYTKMATFQVDPKRFEIIKELYIRALKNFEAEQPYAQATYFTHALKSEKAWLKTDLLAALPNLTCAAIQEFVSEFMSRLHIQMLVHGNFVQSDALMLSNLVEDILKKQAYAIPLLKSQLVRQRDLRIPDGSSYLFQYHNKVRDINAVDLFLQVGMQNTNDAMLLQLLEQIMNEPCFNILRTKENLGYIVSTGIVRSNGVHGLRVVVQSERDCGYLEERIEAFIDHVQDILEKLDDAEFKRHVAALTARILEKPKKLATESLKHWVEILSTQLMFRRPEIESRHLKTIKKEDIVQFYKEYIHVTAPKRSKLVVHVLPKDFKLSQPTSQEQSQEAADLLKCPSLPKNQVIEDIQQFKDSLDLYPRLSAYSEENAAKAAL